jgi:hypothetical protein
MAIVHSYYMGSWNVRRHSGFVGDYLAPSANRKYFVQKIDSKSYFIRSINLNVENM